MMLHHIGVEGSEEKSNKKRYTCLFSLTPVHLLRSRLRKRQFPLLVTEPLTFPPICTCLFWGRAGRRGKQCFLQAAGSQEKTSFQFNSVSQSYPTLCDPMNRSRPGLPVHHQVVELTHTHVHQVGDAIHPSHPLSSPFPPDPNPSQH